MVYFVQMPGILGELYYGVHPGMACRQLIYYDERVVTGMKKCDEVKIVKEDECVTEAKNAFLSVALIVGIVTIIVGICVAVYKYLTPDYLDDFDDFDDDFDDSFFDDDDAVEEPKETE